ncbi:MAG: class I SAM-dependent methyltransferase [Patescibacteria group bacterium]
MSSFDLKISKLQKNPESKVLEKGYINIYSSLNSKERRQIFYKELYKRQHSDWDETMVFLSEYFKKLFVGKEHVTVLDAGCGNGNFVIDENRELISWAVGLDVKPEFTSKNICLDQIEYGSLNTIPFENNSFDSVISLWVLEHIHNANNTFKEINRVLKLNGVFLFATPNKNYLPLRLLDLLKSSKINHTLNRSLFGREAKEVFEAYYEANSLKTLNHLAEKNGFSVEVLKLNYDPGYTSFNKLLYELFSKLSKFSIFQPHIIGVLRKTSNSR